MIFNRLKASEDLRQKLKKDVGLKLKYMREGFAKYCKNRIKIKEGFVC